MEQVKDNCTAMESKLADLLLDEAAVPAKVRAHVDTCDRCSRELAELRATMSLLDAWEAPEPSPYFLSRLDARMREERQAAPDGWFARLRARFAYGPSMHVRPLAAMALTVVLLLGGGTYLGVTDWNGTPAPSGPTAVVHDLQTMDNNAQVLDQLEALSSSNGNGD
jgi:anti-sigma factor RsiW